jgi:hypothetical protein
VPLTDPDDAIRKARAARVLQRREEAERLNTANPLEY